MVSSGSWDPREQWHPAWGLTQVLPLVLGFLPEDLLEHQAQVTKQDEGRGQSWSSVVFNNEVISLKLPENVCIALHHLECVATGHTAKPLPYNLLSLPQPNIHFPPHIQPPVSHFPSFILSPFHLPLLICHPPPLHPVGS